jgi:hypothetical protein
MYYFRACAEQSEYDPSLSSSLSQCLSCIDYDDGKRLKALISGWKVKRAVFQAVWGQAEWGLKKRYVLLQGPVMGCVVLDSPPWSH